MTSVAVKDEALIKASMVGEGSARMHNIRVEVVDGLNAAELGRSKLTELVVGTSDPNQPEIRVPVEISVRQLATRPGASGPAELRPEDIKRMGAAKGMVPQPLPTGTPGIGPH